MAKGIRFTAFVSLDSGYNVSPELMDRIIRKIQALLGRLGCTIRGRWRLAESEEIEDLLG